MYRFVPLEQLNVRGRRVLLRAALDVPLRNGAVANTYRLRALLPTIHWLQSHGAVVGILSWLGRPKGKPTAGYSLAPVGRELQKLLKCPVTFVPDCIGPAVQAALFSARPGDVLLLENVRFHPEEEHGDLGFARELVRGFDLVVFDAFAQSHRAVASTTGLLSVAPAASGLLLERELTVIDGLRHTAPRPRVLVIGGAKVADKVAVIAQLAPHVDRVLVGGVVSNVFLAARGTPLGRSVVDEIAKRPGEHGSIVGVARRLLRRFPHKLTLPQDVRVASRATGKAIVVDVKADEIPASLSIFDIGPQTVERYSAEIARAKTVIWNGPLGVVEQPAFARGTRAVVKAMVGRPRRLTVAGGGDSEEIIHRAKLENAFTHVSTGGGALLAFLGGKKLPALEALQENRYHFHVSHSIASQPPALASFNAHTNPFWRAPFLNLQSMLGPAHRHRFGVPACNIRSPHILRAVLEAAFAERSPVILEIAESEMAYCGIPPERLVELVLSLLPRLEKKHGYTIPITVHADHVRRDIGVADRAVRAGFSSVAIDQSYRPFSQNVEITAAFVRRAHPLGVSVEGELGEVETVGRAHLPKTAADVLRHSPTPRAAREFVRATGIDAFAGFFGNFHGADVPGAVMAWSRLRAVARELADLHRPVPVVLHGSSYLEPRGYNRVNVFHQAIRCGCAKFNYATVLSDLFGEHLPASLRTKMAAIDENGGNWKKGLGAFEKDIDALPARTLATARAAVSGHLRIMMRAAWRSSGAARWYR